MFRIRNYYMGHVLLSPDDGAGVGGAGGAGGAEPEATESKVETAAGLDATEMEIDAEETESTDTNTEIAKLKAELAKQKAAINEATKEAAKYKRQLRDKQSAEEIAAEEQKANEEAIKKELEDLRKENAMAKTVKTVMSRLGTDETTSSKIAEYMYGAEDAEAVLTEIAKAWAAKEKALRLAFGKVPPPGAGGADGEDSETARAIERARNYGKARATVNEQAQKALETYLR